MEWLRTDCFKFHAPNYVEEDHLAVVGLRSDSRVYYAFIAIPSYPADRLEAYKALRKKFDSFLDHPIESKAYSERQYELLVADWVKRRKGFVLDTFPTGE